METVDSEDIEHGIAVGCYNQRGITPRALGEGGAQERKLAEHYQGMANAFRDRWPRTSVLLRRMAHSYGHDADQEDRDVELRE